MEWEAQLPSGRWRVFYYAKDAILKGGINLMDNPVSSMTGILILAATLQIVGASFLVNLNLGVFLKRWEARVQVVAFLEDGVDEARAVGLAERIRGWEGVNSVRLVTREDAWDAFASDPQGRQLLDALGENPLPASLEVSLDSGDRETLRSLSSRLETIQEVMDVDHGEEWVEALYNALILARIVSIGLGAAVMASSIVIVAYTVTHAARAREAEMILLQFLGLPIPWVMAPLLGEGLWLGWLAASAACLSLALCFVALRFFFPMMLIWSWTPVAIMYLLGVGIGLFGSLVSARRMIR